MKLKNAPAPQISTGNSSLDFILGGGLPANHVYLVQGNPGSGKTTLGLRFLLKAVEQGETGLYVSLSETQEELNAVAYSHGWDLEGVHIHELAPSEQALSPDSQYTMFQPSELELNETTAQILEKVNQLKPRRVVFDSLSEMRLLAQNPLRYRRQILALKQYFIGREATVLLLDDKTSGERDLQLESLAHGVITLEQMAPEYGAERRRLRISKIRGAKYFGGYHDFVIRKGGLEVFPRIVAAQGDCQKKNTQPLTSGISELDTMMGGGLDRGGSALFIGPAGVGKSSLAMHYAESAAARGERAEVFIFDERRETLVKRASALSPSIIQYIESDMIRITQIDPAEVSPGELAARVRQAVQPESGARAGVVIIDSLNGYLTSMPEERFLIIQLHELLSYLGNAGVITIMVMAQHGMVSPARDTPIDTSYLSDTVLLLRYFEALGEVRQAISIVKKRTGSHERTIREFSFGENKIRVGAPLVNFEGVLTGVPRYFGEASSLAKDIEIN